MSDLVLKILDNITKLPPISEMKRDVIEISNHYQLPEHILHLTLSLSAIAVGSAMPFISTECGTLLNNILQPFGLPAGLQTFATWGVSTFFFSGLTSAIVNLGNKIARKIIFKDWDYRMTSKECFRIAEELDIPSPKLRKIFNNCVKQYRKLSGSLASDSEEYKSILDDLLHDQPQIALMRYKHQQDSLKRLYAKFEIARRIALNDDQELSPDNSLLTYDLINKSFTKENTSQHILLESVIVVPTYKSITQPATLEDEKDEQKNILTNDKTIGNGKERASSIIDTQTFIPTISSFTNDNYIPVINTETMNNILFCTKHHRLASMDPTRAASFAKSTAAITGIVAKIKDSGAITIPHSTQGQERKQREELIIDALNSRALWLQQKLPTSNIEAILQEHLKLLVTRTNEQLQTIIKNDKEKTTTTTQNASSLQIASKL